MRRRARAKPAAVVDRIASGHNVPVASIYDLTEEAFAGIDRSVSPMSLQHMAPQRPLTPELMREAGAILHRQRDHLADPDPPRGELARLEVRTAERDRALELLDAVERLVARIGGFMTAEDQDLMREVRAALVGSGRRVDERPLWTDRR